MENLGLMYLSAVIKQCGHECKIVHQDDADCDIYHFKPDIVGYSIMTGNQKLFAIFNDRFKNIHNYTSIAGGPHPSFSPMIQC